ncbi:MAG: FISUMP domain-containing protein [Massilibacteroides sp.]|nr:FISUMP domain-containing protein [Massilibacteroides sp.]MDD4661639.1 FISUMP domain-containing protein [Massilibacteroides sp.]
MKKLAFILAALIGLGLSANAQQGDERVTIGGVVWLTKAEYLTKIHNFEKDKTELKYLGNKPAVVVFTPTAKWCGPCNLFQKTIGELAAEYVGKVLFYMVETDFSYSDDKKNGIAEVYGLGNSVPVSLLIPLGETPSTIVGNKSKDIFRNAIDEHLLKTPKADNSSEPVGIKQAQGDEGVTIGGVTWATRNVGAVSPEDYGDYYTWEEAQRACPKGWRLPTKEELESLLNAWNDVETINSNDGIEFGSGFNTVFLPFGGEQYNNKIGDKNFAGYYWGSTQFNQYPDAAYCIDMYDMDGDVSFRSKDSRFSVRCVKK